MQLRIWMVVLLVLVLLLVVAIPLIQLWQSPSVVIDDPIVHRIVGESVPISFEASPSSLLATNG